MHFRTKSIFSGTFSPENAEHGKRLPKSLQTVQYVGMPTPNLNGNVLLFGLPAYKNEIQHFMTFNPFGELERSYFSFMTCFQHHFNNPIG